MYLEWPRNRSVPVCRICGEKYKPGVEGEEYPKLAGKFLNKFELFGGSRRAHMNCMLKLQGLPPLERAPERKIDEWALKLQRAAEEKEKGGKDA